jgi:hypothetical protein
LREIGEHEMRNDTSPAKANQQYAAAHAAHYEAKDLREALLLYKGVLVAHPDTQEAGYARSQIQNIIKEVIPERELLEAQMDRAMVHFGEDRKRERLIPATPAREPKA